MFRHFLCYSVAVGWLRQTHLGGIKVISADRPSLLPQVSEYVAVVPCDGLVCSIPLMFPAFLVYIRLFILFIFLRIAFLLLGPISETDTLKEKVRFE